MEDDLQRLRLKGQHDERDRDFAALFAQLDQPDAAAPIDGGLMQLLNRITDPKLRHDAKSRR